MAQSDKNSVFVEIYESIKSNNIPDYLFDLASVYNWFYYQLILAHCSFITII